MKHFGVFTLLLAAVLSPLVSARLTLLRLAQGDQPSKLRGLSSPREASPEEAHLYVHGCESISLASLLVLSTHEFPTFCYSSDLH